MTINTKVLKLILNGRIAGQIPLPNGLHLQVLNSLRELPTCQKHQSAAFIDDSETLIVWDDDACHLMQRAVQLESQLLEMAWGGNVYRRNEIFDSPSKDETKINVDEVPSEISSAMDVEAGETETHRPTNLMNATMVALTLILILVCLGLGWRKLGMELTIDPKVAIPRLGLLVLTPMQIFLALVSRRQRLESS